MRTVRGDLWETAEREGARVVVTTNIGWTNDGANPMGRGTARQASSRVAALRRWYGAFCRQHGASTPVVEFNAPPWSLLLFPTKPLRPTAPWMSWRGYASLELIERSLRQLVLFPGLICLPLPGCANGGLREEEVLPLLYSHLVDDRFVLVRG